jgi:uncharacterized protein YdhG (YjbR/CyaY superfamily)
MNNTKQSAKRSPRKASTGFTEGEKAAMRERAQELKAEARPRAAKTWYGLPAYAKAGKIVCYLRMSPQAPYNDRYMTFGFNEAANLDEGGMWPIAFAVKELTADHEAMIAALVKKAVSS